MKQVVEGFAINKHLGDNESGPGEHGPRHALDEKAGAEMERCKWHLRLTAWGPANRSGVQPRRGEPFLQAEGTGPGFAAPRVRCNCQPAAAVLCSASKNSSICVRNPTSLHESQSAWFMMHRIRLAMTQGT